MGHVFITLSYVKRSLAITLLSAILSSCGGGSGSGLNGGADCSFNIATTPQSLTMAEVERIVAQAIQASQSVGASSTIAVTDRVGNVLAVYQMTGANGSVTINSGKTLTRPQGLDGLSGALSAEAAIAKAVTGAYLSSSGNAFSTRTASSIIQEHFAPSILNQPSGPLTGVQFSQLPCGDFVTRGDTVSNGPKRSPLGLAGDPGGFPIYKNGVVVGGIGVMSDGVYGIDTNPTSGATDNDEIIAQSALAGFQAPACIRGDKITLGGIIPGYSNADAALRPVSATTLPASGGALLAVPAYFSPATIRAGKAYGNVDSGFANDTSSTLGAGAFVVTDGAVNKFPPTAGVGGLTALEVTQIINSAIGVANQSRAQIRRPVGAASQVTVSIVDTAGTVLGIARTPDAPVFGTDVSLQKARTAAFFSNSAAGAAIASQPPVTYLTAGPTVSVAAYNTAADSFFGSTIFDGGNAFSTRAIGAIARPFFPDGIDGTSHGPLSKPISVWSPFNTGLQLDLIYNKLITAITAPATADFNCAAGTITSLNNGMQIFPGAVPIYRGTTLVGAIGISGDGIDQDDMIAFLGLARAGAILGTGIANASIGIRAGTLSPQGVPLRYVSCPQSPFINSNEQNVCSGI